MMSPSDVEPTKQVAVVGILGDVLPPYSGRRRLTLLKY